MNDVTLGINVAGIDFPSVVLNASGAFNPLLFDKMFTLRDHLGGIVTKTVTRQHTVGNPQQRTVELPGIGMLNSIGLQNPGLDYFLEKEARPLKTCGIPLILSISACSNDEFSEMARLVAENPYVDALEVNLSCPNVEKGGVDFGNAPDTVREAIAAVVSVYDKPVFAKLTPNVTSIVPLGKAAVDGGAVGLTAINTVIGAAIDIRTRKPILKRVSGGYSGPGIKPIALRAVWELHKAMPEIPIMGVGGISTPEDVLEFLMAGASLVQVGTICFRHPMIFPEMTQALKSWCLQEDVAALSQVVGCAHPMSAVRG